METPTPWTCPACGRENAETLRRCPACATYAADAATPAASPTADALADAPTTDPTTDAPSVSLSDPLRVTLRTAGRLCAVLGPDDVDPWTLPDVEILASADDRDAATDPDAVANVRRVPLSSPLAEACYLAGLSYLGGSRRWTGPADSLPACLARERVAAEVRAIDAAERARLAEAATDAAFSRAFQAAEVPTDIRDGIR